MRREEDGVRPSVHPSVLERLGALSLQERLWPWKQPPVAFLPTALSSSNSPGGRFKRKCQCQTAYVSRQAGAERVTHSAVTSSNCDRSRLGAHNTPNFSSTLWRWQFGGQRFPFGCAKASTLAGSCLVTRKTTFPGGEAVVHPAPRCVIVWPRARSLARSTSVFGDFHSR